MLTCGFHQIIIGSYFFNLMYVMTY